MTSLSFLLIRGPSEAVAFCSGSLRAITKRRKIQYSASGDTLAYTVCDGLYAN